MSSAFKILPHYTYAEWAAWKGQWELIEGIPYAMSPSPVPRHQQVAARLTAEFHFQLKNCTHCTTYQPVDYVVAEDTILQPDMLVVCGTITKKFLDFPPALVAEIASPPTSLKDRYTKFTIYQREQIPYYLIISPDVKEVELYALEEAKYVLIQKGSSFTYRFDLKECAATIDFEQIW